MPTYVRLLRFNAQGIKDLKRGPGLLAQARKVYREVGAEVKAAYLVMGGYDVVSIVEAPNDEAMAKVAVAAPVAANFRSVETMRAFTEAEIKQILEGVK